MKVPFQKQTSFSLALLAFAFFSSTIGADERLRSERPHLKGLGKNKSVKSDWFVFPFLVTQTGGVSELTPTALSDRLREHLKQGRLAVPGHYSGGAALGRPLRPADLPIPKVVVSGSQLKKFLKCSTQHCSMKLNIKNEKSVIEKSRHKVKAYHQLVLNRLERYLNKRELWGYEKRLDNQPYTKKMLSVLSFLPKEYPSCTQFLNTSFWSAESSACMPKDSFLKQEIAYLEGLEQLQPIWRVAEVLEFKEGDSHLFFEIHIYTNHHFDSSARVYEVFPIESKKGRSALVVTDVMEIDTLKISGVVRFLYTGKMASATNQYQHKELKKLW